jgi:DNA repair protein RadC
MFTRQFGFPFMGVQEGFQPEYETDCEERILAEARAIAHRRLQTLTHLHEPEDAARYLVDRFLGLPEELFTGLFLNAHHGVLRFEVLFRGSIDGCQIHAREVVRSAIDVNAAAVIFAHNHPSGGAEPSAEDGEVTQRLIVALKLIGVRVLDHLVVGGHSVTSFAQRGWI